VRYRLTRARREALRITRSGLELARVLGLPEPAAEDFDLRCELRSHLIPIMQTFGLRAVSVHLGVTPARAELLCTGMGDVSIDEMRDTLVCFGYEPEDVDDIVAGVRHRHPRARV
jgi:hypothetical protein